MRLFERINNFENVRFVVFPPLLPNFGHMSTFPGFSLEEIRNICIEKYPKAKIDILSLDELPAPDLVKDLNECFTDEPSEFKERIIELINLPHNYYIRIIDVELIKQMVRFLYEKYTEHAGFGFLPEDYNGCIYQYFYEHIRQDIKESKLNMMKRVEFFKDYVRKLTLEENEKVVVITHKEFFKKFIRDFYPRHKKNPIKISNCTIWHSTIEDFELEPLVKQLDKR
eukprot:CAMPEP_0168322362 /NCGR_PEP_ID=MMETSP0213-20121227/2844_1 /TAXON_ID=151035 /ORGANISM="Euplotes harpa, Strain FSP1.4" /LENGTH=225 /DNA_ID=CAMNT_0008324235 /DNA_START=244 /DNA_END=919 /DNA_ORIENTATION=+